MNWALVWAAVTAVGTVLAGLALPLAFFQLGALRQDRLRAQVSKVGVWADSPKAVDGESGLWTIYVHIRNGSELPIHVGALDMVIRPWGYNRVLAAPEGTTEVEHYMDKRFGDSDRAFMAPGAIPPVNTMIREHAYESMAVFDRPEPPAVSIGRVVITDAAGYQWEVRSGKAGPARRVRQWRRWWWKRHGDL